MSRDEKKGLKIGTRRIFSEEFKRQKIQQIVENKLTIKEVSEAYGVTSMSVYRWLYRYSPHHQKGTTQVVQMQSEEQKTKDILRQLAEAERVIGQKQLQLDYLERLILIAGQALKVDLKKTFSTTASNGSELRTNQGDIP